MLDHMWNVETMRKPVDADGEPLGARLIIAHSAAGPVRKIQIESCIEVAVTHFQALGWGGGGDLRL